MPNTATRLPSSWPILMLPVMDGAATIHALTRINPAVKIIATSGLAAHGGITKSANPGIPHFLSKPYTSGALLRKLRAVLDEPRV